MSQAFSASELSAMTGYAGNPLNRQDHWRHDAARLSEVFASPATRFALFHDRRLIMAEGSDTPYRSGAMAGLASLETMRSICFLGTFDGVAYASATLTDLPPDHEPVDLRMAAYEGRFSRHDLGILAEATALNHWHETHGFCARCGASTALAIGGWKRVCSSCEAQHFPRTDPVAIMLVVDPATGDVLLGRQHGFLPGVYSCLAGFVEPGETLENAVRRETLEEAGVIVGAVRVMCNQPWPFPSTLMIGCLAQAQDRAITVDETELEDVRWFTKDQLRAMLARPNGCEDGFSVPPPLAIAHTLLASYAEGRFDQPD